MKRSRVDEVNDNLATLANYLMLLSGTSTSTSTSWTCPATSTETTYVPTVSGRIFECKTCNRQFPSFQALGGHRASHKKPRLADSSPENSSDNNYSSSSSSSLGQAKPPKSKTSHECSICGVEFALGQALGGHMRRHRTVPVEGLLPSTTLSLSMLSCPLPPLGKKPPSAVKGINSDGGIRTLCLDLCL